MSDDIYIGIMCLIGFDISADISVDKSVARFIEHRPNLRQVSIESQTNLDQQSAVSLLTDNRQITDISLTLSRCHGQ